MSGRVVIVTGSSGGIGAVTADRFRAAGEVVVGLDLIDGFDVTDPDAVEAGIARSEVLAPAKSLEQMHQIVTNNYVDAALAGRADEAVALLRTHFALLRHLLFKLLAIALTSP